MRRPPVPLLFVACAFAGAFAPSVHAQVVRGTVLSERTRAVPGAEVLLSDSAGPAGNTHTGNRGEYFMRIRPGSYVVEVRRIGFLPARRGNFDLREGDTLSLDIELELLPQKLRAIQVVSERHALKQTRVLGMSLRGIDVAIMTPTEVAMAARGARTWLDVVRSGGLSGLTVGADCVRSMHALRGDCAVVLVDDIRVDDRENIQSLIAPRTIDHIIYLKAAQATTLLGTGVPGGALLIYTNIGARIANP